MKHKDYVQAVTSDMFLTTIEVLFQTGLDRKEIVKFLTNYLNLAKKELDGK